MLHVGKHKGDELIPVLHPEMDAVVVGLTAGKGT